MYLLATVFEVDRISFFDSDFALGAEWEGPGKIDAVCGTADNMIWAIAGTSNTTLRLYKINPLSGARIAGPITPGTPISFLFRKGYSIREHPSGDLIIGTGTAVVRMTTAGVTVRTYGLNATDFAINSDGTLLLYADGPSLQLWDLENDSYRDEWAAFPDIQGNEVRVQFPNWLSDCSVVCAVEPGPGSYPLGRPATSIIRVQEGYTLLQEYEAPDGAPDEFDEWPIGVAADLDANRVWAMGDWDEDPGCNDDARYLRSYDLDTGAVVQTSIDCYDDLTDAVGQVVVVRAPDPGVKLLSVSFGNGRNLRYDNDLADYVAPHWVAPTG